MRIVRLFGPPTLLTLVVLGGFASCDTYEAPEYVPFHEAFVWGPGHGPPLEEVAVDGGVDTDGSYDANPFCEKCHVDSAAFQIAEGITNRLDKVVVPDQPGSGWVTQPSQLCEDCHPNPIGIDITAPCALDDTSEWCRYQRGSLHVAPFEAPTCGGGACHQLYPPTTWVVGGGNGGSHNTPPLSELFPLTGGHDPNVNPLAPVCTDCHLDPGGDYTLERGKSTYCSPCHTRAGEGKDETHYPPDRVGWTDERERDCFSCHATVTTGNDMIMPDTWAEVTYQHIFRFPHRTVVDWDVDPPTPRPVDEWKSGCDTCHDVGLVTTGSSYVDLADGRFSCGRSGCHDFAQLQTDYSAFHGNIYNDLGSCNESNCHPSGTVVGDREPN